MTALDAVTAPDIARLNRDFESAFLPAVAAFVQGRCSGNELREAWRPYYYDVFQEFDREIEQAWRAAAGSEGRVESGPPQADPAHKLPLSLFPVSVAHNNLDRLVEVLAVELGEGRATDGNLPERIVDLAHVVDSLHRLMTSLATTA